MKTPDLKPCQAVARGTIRWKDDWQDGYYVCRADCNKCDRHAEARVHNDCMDGFVELITERDVIQELCRGCKEVENDAFT